MNGQVQSGTRTASPDQERRSRRLRTSRTEAAANPDDQAECRSADTPDRHGPASSDPVPTVPLRSRGLGRIPGLRPIDQPAELSTDEVARRAGLTYRQVHHWVSTGHIEPSIEYTPGTGNQWRWSRDDAAFLASVAARLAWGMTLDRALDPDPTPPPALALLIEAPEHHPRWAP